MRPSVLAVIADVHGNSWALDAVLADARASGAETYLNLGDCVFGPIDPAGTADRLLRDDVLTVRGNQDRLALADGDHPTRAFVRSALSAEYRRWLERLPSTATYDGMTLCHGTPDNDETYLLEQVHPHGTRERDPEDVQRLVAGINTELLFCGHSHKPRVVELPGGVTVCNPGSVGLPAYADDRPHPHVMEVGSPEARYCLLRRVEATWRIEPRAVAYDCAAAAAAARRRGRNDWAMALETGRAPRANLSD